MGMRAAGSKKAEGQPRADPLANLDGTGELMRKPRPNAYNPAQALFLISNDRSGSPLSCPSCAGSIERDPLKIPPPPYAHVTLRCKSCGRSAHYVAGAA